MDVHRPIVTFRGAERDPQQAIADRLRVRARLGEPVRAPVLEGTLAEVVRRSLLDVESGPVGDHALEGDELRIGGRAVELLLEASLELLVGLRVLAQLRDPRLDPADPMNGRRAVGGELVT